jgi:large subunit ribosomal protein L35
MPKMKTHRGAAKRFRLTGTRRLRRRRQNRNHILEKKSASRKRRLAQDADVSPADRQRVRRMLAR